MSKMKCLDYHKVRDINFPDYWHFDNNRWNRLLYCKNYEKNIPKSKINYLFKRRTLEMNAIDIWIYAKDTIALLQEEIRRVDNERGENNPRNRKYD